ncbi:hypothetical protein D1007_01794 [Hordeum vulgare]|nr:hypothetical protein D1007_01794 [Hordeum vulgare]
MENFELDPERFLPQGHNIIDAGPDWLPRTYTMPVVPSPGVMSSTSSLRGWGQPAAAADGGGWEPEAAAEAQPTAPEQDQESMVID